MCPGIPANSPSQEPLNRLKESALRPETLFRISVRGQKRYVICVLRGPFDGHFEYHLTMAAVDPFRPGRFIIIYLGSALARDRPSVAW